MTCRRAHAQLAEAASSLLKPLQGSERLKKTLSEDQRLREAKGINSSLSALGKVVMALAQGGAAHVPFRDSKLTRVLKVRGKSSQLVSVGLNWRPATCTADTR